MNTLEAFQTLDIRTGTIVAVDDFLEAVKPLYKITVDFGSEVGKMQSGAGLKPFYPNKDDLIGKRIVAVVNLPPKKIINFESQCLLLGAMDEKTGTFALLEPDREMPDGLKVF